MSLSDDALELPFLWDGAALTCRSPSSWDNSSTDDHFGDYARRARWLKSAETLSGTPHLTGSCCAQAHGSITLLSCCRARRRVRPKNLRRLHPTQSATTDWAAL